MPGSSAPKDVRTTPGCSALAVTDVLDWEYEESNVTRNRHANKRLVNAAGALASQER
jgi:hypothetical protein